MPPRSSPTPYPSVALTGPGRMVTSLRLGERVLVRSNDGPLAAEYAVFEASDIVLQATDPLTVREAGYTTTARRALDRLARAGVTPDLASDAASSLDPLVTESFARGRSARAVASQLRAHELFDGALYDSLGSRYEGAWLDLRALTTALGIDHAPVLLQALHLAAALGEVDPSTPVHLSTAAITRDRRPGERTHVPVALDGAAALPDALKRLAPNTLAIESGNDRLLRRALHARVRERMAQDNSPPLRAHLSRLEAALTLLSGDEPPRSVAEALSEIAYAEPASDDAALVAARTWLAVGEAAHSRHFARRLAEDPSASDGERLVALEILDSTHETGDSEMPPAAAREEPPPPAPRLPAEPAPSFAPEPTPVPPRPDPELVESLPLPEGLDESMLGQGEVPRTPQQARIAMTRLARDLARDYRLWYGTALGCDVRSLESMQQHLMDRFTGAEIGGPVGAWELRRHGAFLSEIIARALGGVWVDIAPSEPRYWAMVVPPSTRSCPIGRVYEFLALGHRGRDLVGYYLDLEAGTRARTRG